MITELDLLHVLKNRANFQRFKPLVKEHAVTDRTLKIINDLETFYTINPGVDEVDWNTFSTWFKLVKNASMKSADMDLYTKIFDNLVSFKPAETVEAIQKHFITLDYAGRMLEELNNVVAGKTSSDLIFVDALYAEWADEVKLSSINDDDDYANSSLKDILDTAYRKGGLEWKLEDLNVGIGPLHKGDLIIVGTRPEVGKTTFSVDQVTFMLQQLGPTDKLLWVNNEEDGDRIMLRAYQSVLNKDLREILKDELKAQAEFDKLILDRVKVYDKPGATVQDIERQCKKHNPKIIVFNVMDKVNGFSEEGNEVGRLRKLFQWGRELAKKYGIVFALAQADGSAEGQKWIFQDQLYGSKTGVQGEADVIITIGAVHDPKFKLDRFIHVPKNKLPGGPRSDPTKRHGYFTVTIDPDRATFITKDYK